MLKIAIESLILQTYPHDKYELIICDNNSRDNTKEVVEQFIKKNIIRISYVFEGRQGLHFARHTGARHSTGEILFFTDDDMVADKDLLVEIIRAFELDDKVAVVTGKILPRWMIEPPIWVPKLCNNFILSLNDRGDNIEISNDDLGAFGCHLAIRKDVFYKAGGFNLEVEGEKWLGDGETGLNIKVKELGFKFAYNGKSVIYHMIPPSRMTQKYLNKRLANQGNTNSYTEYRQRLTGKIGLYKNIIIYFVGIVKQFVKITIKFIMFDYSWRINVAYIFYFLNRIKYDYRLISDENWKKIVLKNDWLEA